MTAPLAIATAESRTARVWSQETMTWDELLKRLSLPADKKDCGGYVLGTLRDGRRTRDTVIDRHAVTLDVDHPSPTFLRELDRIGYLVAWHTTFSSSLDSPRYRLILPTDRPMTPEEFTSVADHVMEQLGKRQFDPGSNQPSRMMFWPATGSPGTFQHGTLGDGLLPVDDILMVASAPEARPSRHKRNPFELAGVPGAFNRVFQDWQDLVARFDLPYRYVGSGRFALVGADGAAGMGQCSPGLVFSHHAGDPAGGYARSAFDLVRLHRFGHLDADAPAGTPVNRLPSHEAMVSFATSQPEMGGELLGEDFMNELTATADSVDQDNWQTRLDFNDRGKLRDTPANWELIAQHDPGFTPILWNEMTASFEISGDLPWRKRTPTTTVFDGADRSSLTLRLQRVYGLSVSTVHLDNLILERSHTHRYHPVRDYLNSLHWDGRRRVERALPGVADTPYSRLVARKVLAAAVARVMEPGCKWDHMLVLFGGEGIGKTFWIEKMARGWSAPLSRIDNKDTLLVMQRSWIMLSDESNSLRKAEFNAQKEFLTRSTDVYRQPYDRETRAHPRQCVIWGTTNDEVFLRNQEGNRRFLIVRCEEAMDFEGLTDYEVDQTWAEAVQIYQEGERLYLTQREAEMAVEARQEFVEEDALTGIIQRYLDMPVPRGWDTMTPMARQMWIANGDDLSPAGDHLQDTVCSAQIWVEALGRRFGEHKRTDLLDITSAMKQIPGWRADGTTRRRIPHYGPQLAFVREV